MYIFIYIYFVDSTFLSLVSYSTILKQQFKCHEVVITMFEHAQYYNPPKKNTTIHYAEQHYNISPSTTNANANKNCSKILATGDLLPICF